MQKRNRKPAELDTLELYRRLDVPISGTTVADGVRVEAAFGLMRDGLKAALARESTVHAWRAQAMFASMVVALDSCELLTTIDTGDVFFDGNDVKPADFFLALRGGRRLVVDVKSIAPAVRGGIARLSPGEVAALVRFATLYGAELYIACLFASVGAWTLLAIDQFEIDSKGRYFVDLSTAMIRNEMALLGDYLIAIEAPIVSEMLADLSYPRSIDDNGRASLTIGAVNLSIGGRPLFGETERRIAYYLMMFSGWTERQEAMMDADGSLAGIRFIAQPEIPSDGQQWQLVGALSTLYATSFSLFTHGEDGVTALDVTTEPGYLSSLIPINFSSDELPMLRMELVATLKVEPPL